MTWGLFTFTSDSQMGAKCGGNSGYTMKNNDIFKRVVRIVFAIAILDKPLFLCNNSIPVIQDESIRHREETSLYSAETSKQMPPA